MVHTVVGRQGVFKFFAGFFHQLGYLFLPVPGRKMADDQFAGTSLPGCFSGFSCCGMKGEPGLVLVFIAESRLVVEQVNSFYMGQDIFRVCRIRAEGVCPLPIGGFGNFFIGDGLALRGDKIGSAFYIVNFTHGNIVFLNEPFADVQFPGLFHEQEAGGINFMAEWKGVHLYPQIFIDFYFLPGVKGMETDGIIELAFIVADDVPDAFPQGLMGIYMEVLCAVEQVE